MKKLNLEKCKSGNKGITLIALVITIIVLLILAGVTIAQLTGSDSAPAKANEAKQTQDIGAARDQVYLTASNAQTEAYERIYVDGKQATGNEDVTAGNASANVSAYVKSKINTEYGEAKKVGSASIQATNGGATITISTTDFKDVGTIGETGGTLTWSGVTTNNGTAPVTPTSYTITYNANGGSGEMEETTGASPAVVANTFTAPTAGQTFVKWNTAADGSGIDYDVGDTPGASITLYAQWTVASTGTSITVNGTDIDLSTLNASTVGQYYGTTVATLDGKEYGLFYVDYAGTYSGGEAGTIYLRAKTSVGSTALNSPSLSSDALNIMKQLNPQWNSARGTATSLTSAEQGAQHLCNPAVSTWSAAKTAAETEFGASNVNYVIGAPSVELYLASYNAKYSSGYSADFRAAGANYTYPGYLYSNNGGSSYAQYYSNAIPSNNSGGGMYLNSSATEWLASPLSGYNDDYVCRVRTSGDLNNNNWYGSLGVAPLVSLKSGVDLTQD